MKILFLTRNTDDYLATCLWHGLRSILGDNVVDATGSPSLMLPSGSPNGRILGGIGGRSLNSGRYDHQSFDLLVINACFLADHDWHLAITLRHQWLKDHDNVVLVEGADGANEVNAPPFRVRAVFRREIDPSLQYGYGCSVYPLSFAAPPEWFYGSGCGYSQDRPWDVFFAGPTDASPTRWSMMEKVWQTRGPHRSLIASRGIGMHQFFDDLKQSKLALCPPGAANSVALRTFEIAASGAIPIMIGLPAWTRDPWFQDGEHCFTCETVDSLPGTIDRALAMGDDGLGAMRRRLVEHARQWHTTVARARRLLDVVGMAST